ncbi:M20/M25/M40 family metallo-hydrolase [Microbacterium murale]|uniref:Acetylornithine deacetylase/succinyl-diaminopimelate desuccinylase-like protein n=1 Tax=Microbacterium murale TaxID=1081040 RepID=A0ABU0PB31_9MICO|nr:M20/M25/M40 family metallo-hydrolase [Microbacterium murale]MDQ0644543.1 acetylornithine deacetylase/succinyl-diaminopimelate desuccinylase-like protein [Microbacterium murale]
MTLSRLEEEALGFVRDLIRIDSINTGDLSTIGDGETRAARFVQASLEEAGIETSFVEPVPGRGSVIARLRGTDPDAGALIVHAHLDVVPVNADAWTHPPFSAEIEDGLLYGRGAVDMKNFAGVILAVARHFARSGIRHRRDLIFAFLADEESGGVWGASWLVDNRPDLFTGATEAISEVGGFSVPLVDDRRAYLFATAEKGVGGLRLIARGEAGHASRPLPSDPVPQLAGAVARIGAHRFPVVRTPALSRFLAVFGEARGVTFTDENLDAELEDLGFVGRVIAAAARNTAAPTVLRAGDKSNIIPGSAEALVDYRALPDGEDDLLAEVERLAGETVEVERLRSMKPVASPVDGPFVEVISAALTAEDPDGVVVPYLLPASTDNKHFARLGVNGYGFVPLRVPDDFDVYGQFHSADECVPVESLYFCARVTAGILATA